MISVPQGHCLKAKYVVLLAVSLSERIYRTEHLVKACDIGREPATEDESKCYFILLLYLLLCMLLINLLLFFLFVDYCHICFCNCRILLL